VPDICEDNLSAYDIREEERSLIEAAKALGHWLKRQTETTREQSRAIEQMLEFLQALPAQSRAGFAGEFGFTYVVQDEFGAHRGSWAVSVCRGMFEIFSTGREESEEFCWLLCPGRRNTNELFNVNLWTQQVQQPRALAIAGTKFTIDASVWETNDDAP
jgi:hypothetical protein